MREQLPLSEHLPFLYNNRNTYELVFAPDERSLHMSAENKMISPNEITELEFSEILELTPEEKKELLKMWNERHT